MSIQYSAHIVWSHEDGAYVAMAFELPGCMADGASQEEALSNLQEAAKQWIAVAKEEGRDLPTPQTLEGLEEKQRQFQSFLKNHIQQEVQNAVQRVLNQIASSQIGIYGNSRFSIPDLETVGG
jgi:predicted RNase H-like HicB family nuclease